MKVVGVTGNFGTGKTLVASVFGSMGAEVIDADKIAREVTKKGTVAYRKIVRAFGRGVLKENGDIDRKALSRAAFAGGRNTGKLNGIVHPETIRRIKAAIRKSSRDIVVVDAPLIAEAGIQGIFDALVVVRCPRSAEIGRCMKKFGISRAQVLSRIRRQMPQPRLAAMADFIIDNDGSKTEVRRKARQIWETIRWR